ncbi:hypothetical protein EV643_104263 [Kribbella sp. VKM Ac-2527]|uniref:VOC family protein n=1 Tax=Kribbella caucasensis TaxID=2512215 RepID=A0A4R6KN43_9ACTN|nr:hypothetical protein EV643_104263 [Kribbella sp. VKM Ac-2527]
MRVDVQTIPALPCRDLDDVLPFYLALGFRQTYRQTGPNPYLCLSRGDGFDLHFFGLPEFDPENSLGNVIVTVSDTGILYDEFAAGLRSAYGKLPLSGIPRITRPRRKQGTAAGFSVVDPGGNWLRITAGPEDEGAGSRLERVLLNAARQGDSHGDESAAIAVLESGLRRHSDATDAERLPLLVYLAELVLRTGDADRARAVLKDIEGLDTSAVADELAELKRQLTD